MARFDLNDLGLALNAGASAIEKYGKQATLSELGQQMQSGDYKGAARTALSAGDIGTGLKLLELGRQREADASIAPLLSGIGDIGGGAQPQQAAPSQPMRLPGAMKGAEEYMPVFAQAGSRYGVSPDFLAREAQIESNFDPNARSSTGAAGLMQFTRGTAKQYGLGNPMDPNASIDAAAHLAADNKKVLAQALGRMPSDAELYLAHQQGAAGAAGLLSNPNAPAESIVGRKAVVVNGGRPGMTAGEFAGMWLNKFGNAGTGVGGANPVQVADASGAIPQSAGAGGGSDALMTRRNSIMRALATPGISDTAQQKLKLMLQDTEFQIQRGDRIDERDYRRQTLEQQRADKSEERQFRRDQLQQQSIAGQIRQREAEASRLGLQGDDRTQFIANGKIPAQNEKQTGEQANAATFATRMAEADKVISDPSIFQAGLGVSGGAREAVKNIPGVGNALAGYGKEGPKFQQFDQAKRDFVNAVLRKESGAAISANEFANAERQYFPVPGDSQEVLAQKAKNRATAIDTIAQGGNNTFRKSFAEKRAPSSGPSVGAVEDGYRFKGGNPADPSSWEKQ